MKQIHTDNSISIFEMERSDIIENTANLVNFLHESLAQYTDPKTDIKCCLEYVLGSNTHTGEPAGNIFVAKDSEILGVVVVVKTFMDKFIPPYLLVYIAVGESSRGKGVGSMMMQTIQRFLNKPIALHVEHENPAKKLYSRLGFSSKYAEMRWYP